MAKQNTDRYAELQDTGPVSDATAGLKVISGIYAVRIHSKDYYALIMNDYLPTLGRIDGDVVFLNQGGEHPYYGIRGFYKHQHNEFTLLIEEYTGKETE